MLDRTLEPVRRKLVVAMRQEPAAAPAPGRAALDRWMASRLSREEMALLFRLEELYGEGALAEWFAEALLEAGVVRGPASVN
ncbi:MAG: hypothetical protein QM767_17130 [Anaeromyxobacter sp.]